MIKYGNDVNYWIESGNEMDISRGSNEVVLCETTTYQLKFAPKRSALVIIDMQNFFLSEKLGRPETGRKVIPSIKKSIAAARKIGMPIIWLNWGVREDQANLPPSVLKVFNRSGNDIYTGFGNQLPDGLGPLLTKGSWSTELAEGLAEERKENDVWVDKHRTSGFFGTELDQILTAKGISTLFFAGVNADQCVKGTLDDAHCIGYDCILLSDCTATSSPKGAYESVIHNVEIFGFVTSSNQLIDGKNITL